MDYGLAEMAGLRVFDLDPQPDERGHLTEIFRVGRLQKVTGRDFTVAQINVSVSKVATIRGMHGSRGCRQAKFVTCLKGEILDVVLDTRAESETFGSWAGILLTETSPRAVFIDDGLAHGFQALSSEVVVMYAMSAEYQPQMEFAVNPLDPDLRLPWRQLGPPVMSRRDRDAPSLSSLFQDRSSAVWDGRCD